MEKIFVYVVNTTEKAIEVNHKLNDLDKNDDINIYQSLTLRKKADGSFEVLKDNTDGGGWKTLGGAAVGGLIGILGGPLGVLLGSLTGSLIGSAVDTNDYGVSANFLEELKNKINVDEIAVITIIDEANPDFVNTSLQGIGGVSFRTDLADAQESFDDRVETEEEIDRQARKAKREARKAEWKEKIHNWFSKD